MADERARLQVFQGTGAIPGALVFGEEHVALGIHAQSAGRPQAAGRGNQLAIGRQPQGPAAEQVVAGERTGQAEGHPEVPLVVELGSKCIFMIVSIDFPGVADGLEEVGPAVTVVVLHAGDLAPLHGVEPAVLVGQAQNLVQAVGEPGEGGGFGVRGPGVCRRCRSRPGGWRPPGGCRAAIPGRRLPGPRSRESRTPRSRNSPTPSARRPFARGGASEVSRRAIDRVRNRMRSVPSENAWIRGYAGRLARRPDESLKIGFGFV